MEDIIQVLEQIDASVFNDALQVLLQRHEALFPEWEMNVVMIEKSEDRNAQIDRTIAFLERMKK